ncbi:unnamed protein product [Allacma fusca]|uniref:AAA+ ATPase domain-containing protein n=1 Tax=Allacma fusca TaxID=39272 RepID=A0A8J2NH80_9HEXA|nr:unnamed protein product [Allacma fusca]
MLDFNELQRPIDPVAAGVNLLIDNALTKERRCKPPRRYLGASRLGHPCSRALQYEYMHSPISDVHGISGQTLRIFEAGHLFEELAARWLRLAGFELVTMDSTGKQFGFKVAEGKIAGNIDGVITAAPANSTINITCPALWEAKSMNNRSWQETAKKGLIVSKPVYAAQVALYQAYMETSFKGISQNPCLFTAINKNTAEIYHELVPFNADLAQRMSDKAVNIIKATEAMEMLPRAFGSREYYECKFCPYQDKCWEDLVAFRSFPEKGNDNSKPLNNIWVKRDENFINKALEYANLANQRKTAFYVIPGIVATEGKAGSADIIEMQTLLVDIDEGNTEEKLTILESTLGEATLIVESGGVTKTGHAKLHIYWQLLKAATGEELQKLLELRHNLALAIGGDTHFRSAHQPIRVAGSIYHKGGVGKLVKIRAYNAIEYELTELIEKVINLPSLSSNNAAKNGSNEQIASEHNTRTLSIDQIMIQKVHEGGNGEQTRFNHITAIIGFWLRRWHQGLVTEAVAMEEIRSFNLANMIPPWPDDRVRQTINGLWKIHVQKYGEPKKMTTKENIGLTPINPSDWQGSPPEREWILPDWLPRGYVTAIYGDGGVGKSLLAQQLMTALATGSEFMGMRAAPCKIYALMCEDDEHELWRRQASINAYYGLDMKALENNLRIVSRVGENNLLMIFNNSDSGQLTEFFNILLADIAAYGPDLIILDTAADLFGGNENNRPQVRQFIQTACGSLARETRGAVLLCAHPSEGGIQKGTGSGGSTAWNNTVRSRWYLKRPEGSQFTKNHRVLARVKSNYSTTGNEQYLEWSNGAFVHLNQLDFSPRIASQTQGARNDAERDRKTEVMLRLVESEALEGRLYTINQFSENFEGKYGFGSKRCIHSRISVAATQGLMQFIQNPTLYKLAIKSCNYGYLCTKHTMLKTEIIEDLKTGEVKYELIRIIPTHYKCKLNGALIPIET